MNLGNPITCRTCGVPAGQHPNAKQVFTARLTAVEEEEFRGLWQGVRAVGCPTCGREGVGIDPSRLNRAQLHRLVALLTRCAAGGVRTAV
jgi:hypothetical protein